MCYEGFIEFYDGFVGFYVRLGEDANLFGTPAPENGAVLSGLVVVFGRSWVDLRRSWAVLGRSGAGVLNKSAGLAKP